MELRHIRYFLAVVDTGGFTAAAKRCNVSQPSLSQQIIDLEQELGQPLFQRLGRRNLLTSAGERFLAYARQVQESAESALRAARDDPEHPRGTVHIGAIPTVGPYLVPQFLDRCRTLLPDVEIRTLEDFATYLMDELLAGELDFALVARVVPDPRLEVEALYREPLLLAVSSDHRLAQAPRIGAADLANERLVLLGEKSSLTAQIRRFLGEGAVEPRVAHRCAQVETVKALVAAGAGVAILPQTVREPRADARRHLIYRTLTESSPSREISLVRYRGRYQSPAARAVARLIKEALAPQTELSQVSRRPSDER